jgi:hypothetical protein
MTAEGHVEINIGHRHLWVPRGASESIDSAHTEYMHASNVMLTRRPAFSRLSVSLKVHNNRKLGTASG